MQTLGLHLRPYPKVCKSAKTHKCVRGTCLLFLLVVLLIVSLDFVEGALRILVKPKIFGDEQIDWRGVLGTLKPCQSHSFFWTVRSGDVDACILGIQTRIARLS